MGKLERNPYGDLRLQELADALSARARALDAGTRVGRGDTTQLLNAAAWILAPNTAHPNAPARLVREGERVLDSYLPLYELEARALRYWILNQAADALGHDWDRNRVLTHRVWDTACGMALHDEAGLREALALLDETARAHRCGPPAL